jgi:hypothetical protein
MAGGKGGGGGGGGKKGGAPAPPDYMGAANMQDISAHPNQSSPFASSSWTRSPVYAQGQNANTGHYADMWGNTLDGPGAPGGSFIHDQPSGYQWNQQTGFSGPLEQANQSLQGQFANGWGSPLDNGAQARSRAENAAYGQESSRLDPMWNQREQQMRTQLEQQGIDPNSAAGQTQMDTFGRSRNDAYSSALNQAITMGGQEGQRAQQMDLQSRMAPLAGLSGLQGLLAQPGAPQGANYLAAALGLGNYNLGAAGLNNQSQADKKGGLTSLGGSTAPYWAPGVFGAGGGGAAAAAPVATAAFI